MLYRHCFICYGRFHTEKGRWINSPEDGRDYWTCRGCEEVSMRLKTDEPF